MFISLWTKIYRLFTYLIRAHLFSTNKNIIQNFNKNLIYDGYIVIKKMLITHKIFMFIADP